MRKIFFLIFSVSPFLISAQEWDSTGDNFTNGKVEVRNPNNENAVSFFSWYNDVARIRIGGSNIGSQNGLDIQGVGDVSLMRILGTGNIGIGTATPISKLHVAGDIRSETGFVLTGVARFSKKDSNTAHLWSNGDIEFGVSGINTNMILNSSGNLGIGTLTPTEALEVNGNINLGISNFGTETRTDTYGNKLSFQGAHNNTDALWMARYNVTASPNASELRVNIGDDLTHLGDKFSVGVENSGLWNPRFVVQGDGNVGIGTSSSNVKLHVARGPSGGTPHGFSEITLEDDENSMISILTPNDKIGYFGFADNDDPFVGGIQYIHGSDVMIFRVNNHSSDVVINSSGNVGIGTTTTGNHKLAVEGSIGAREIKVEATGWSDFVFENDYNLPTLKEVENHITEKGHLQDIPSAEEVAENGFYLGEMDAKLLQKIEELTLYTIEQEKEIDKLTEKVEKTALLEKQLLLLSKRLELLEEK